MLLGDVGQCELNERIWNEFLGATVHKLDDSLRMVKWSCCQDERDSEEERVWRTFTFELAGKVVWAEWNKSSSLGENMREDHNGQIILRAKLKFEDISAIPSSTPKIHLPTSPQDLVEIALA